MYNYVESAKIAEHSWLRQFTVVDILTYKSNQTIDQSIKLPKVINQSDLQNQSIKQTSKSNQSIRLTL